MAWFIDSWAVLDGLAFASEREPESMDADLSVFLAPPEFRPVPMGKVSTGVAASRRHFQAGLRNENGVEVEFGTLEEVVEAVRCGYLLGGGGEPAPPEGTIPPDVGPLPRGPNGSDSSDEESGRPAVSREQWEMLHSRMTDLRGPQDREDLVALATDGRIPFGDGVRDTISSFAKTTVGTLACMKLAGKDGRVRQAGDLLSWVHVLSRVGLWSDPHELLDWHPACAQILLDYRRWYRFSPDCDIHRAVLDGLLFRIPCPPNWPQAIRSPWLGDHLCLLAGDRRYVDNLDSPETLAPILCCALAISAAPLAWTWAGPRRWSEKAWELHWHRAFRWFVDILPDRGALSDDVEATLVTVRKQRR